MKSTLTAKHHTTIWCTKMISSQLPFAILETRATVEPKQMLVIYPLLYPNHSVSENPWCLSLQQSFLHVKSFTRIDMIIIGLSVKPRSELTLYGHILST